MKTIIATAIALTIATTASATVAPSPKILKWSGSTTNDLYPSYCSFGTAGVGGMDYAPDTKKWTTTSDATLTVTARKVSNIKVEAQGQLYKSMTTTNVNVAVDYRDTWVTVEGSGATAVKNTATVSPTNSAEITGGFPTTGSAMTVVKIKLGGTATVSNPHELLESSAYQIHHKVTCTL